MPLREHLAELRRRLLVCAAAVALGAVAGWFLYDWLLEQLQRPLHEIETETGRTATLNFADVASSFNLKVKLAVYLGLLVASPVWLYEVWAFITPGLTRKERRYSIAFVGTAVPLFLGGVALAWTVLPNAVKILTDFTPEGASNIIDAQSYLTFATRLLLAFGIAFVVPLILVALNFTGLMSGAALGRQWRIAVFVCFLFAAIASPSPDAASMLFMAFPMVGLYVLAVAICLLNDRRRARRAAAELAALSDDEASSLDLPGDVSAAAEISPTTSIDHADGADGAESDRPR